MSHGVSASPVAEQPGTGPGSAAASRHGQAASAPAILQVEGVSRTYAGTVRALEGVSVTVAQGEFLALVGPSGCGKTTLLKLIAGFEQPDGGRLVIDGRDMAGVPPQKRPTSMVFQRLALFPHMTVGGNISFPLRLRQVPAQDQRRRVLAMLELMHLSPSYLGRYPRQLSGGEQQRVALARSMVSEPKLLLLDEPMSALDVKLKKALQAELKRLHREVGVTFVHVTHDLEEAMMLADRICVMRAGRILQVGSPSDIYYRPADGFVAGFIGETNLLPVTLGGREHDRVAVTPEGFALSTTHLPAAQVAAQIDDGLARGPARMVVRPEMVRVLGPGETAEATLEAQITETFGKGGVIQYRAVSARGQELVFEIPGTARPPAAYGDHVRLGWSLAEVHVLAAEPPAAPASAGPGPGGRA